ncbi:MAG: DUF6644 family protein [Acidobacteriota bacterium]
MRPNELLAQSLAESSLRDGAIWLLSNVPGLPPITQSIHILGVAAVMASSVLIDLRLLGLAVPSQEPSAMIRRLQPWTWVALAVNLVTGLPFLLARPYRYFLNPIFGAKVVGLLIAVAASWMLHRWARSDRSERIPLGVRVLAVMSLLAWVLVVFAGRWIAYVDYLFWSEG